MDRRHETVESLVGSVAIVLLLVGIHDLVQKQHAILRNYPVIGHLRFFFEEIGEYFRQYFFAGDRDEMPFNRATRAWVYRLSKNEGGVIGFGSTFLSVFLGTLAAYAFSRYSFMGDKHLFFWLLTNRMAPPAVFLLPFFQLYTTLGMMDTHIAVALAHLLFNVPLAVWILEGFVSGVPREIDETAFLDGYSFPRFFVKILIPLIASGIGVAAFFCFMFSWVELLMARTLTSVNAKPIVATMTRTVSASGMDWATLAAAGVLTIVPGAIVIWFVRHYIAKGFAMGRV